MLSQDNCPACALLTPDKSEKGDKLVDPSSVTVIGPSTSAAENMETTDTLPTKASNPASSHPSGSEFADFKD